MKIHLTIILLLFLSLMAIHAQEKNGVTLPLRQDFRNEVNDSFRDSLNRSFMSKGSRFIDLIDKSSLLDIQYGLEKIFLLPVDTSYYMRRIVLLSMIHNPEAQRLGDEYAKAYRNVMSKPFLKELKKTRPNVLYSGTLDPVELLRGWKCEERARKVREVIAKLNYLEERDSTAKRLLLIRNAELIQEALAGDEREKRDTIALQ